MAKEFKDEIVYVENLSGAVNAMTRKAFEALNKEPSLQLKLVPAPKKAKKPSEKPE